MSVKFSKPNIKETDLNLVKKVIRSGWLTHGKNTSLFEQKFKSYTKSKYSVTVSSCTAALHLSCLALNLKKEMRLLCLQCLILQPPTRLNILVQKLFL